jgi:hypothetical protein
MEGKPSYTTTGHSCSTAFCKRTGVNDCDGPNPKGCLEIEMLSFLNLPPRQSAGERL